MSYLQYAVSGARRRYKDDKYDIDLTYICKNRVIVCSYPEQGLQVHVRNDYKKVSLNLANIINYCCRSNNFWTPITLASTRYSMSAKGPMQKICLKAGSSTATGRTTRLLRWPFCSSLSLKWKNGSLKEKIKIMWWLFTATQEKVELEALACHCSATLTSKMTCTTVQDSTAPGDSQTTKLEWLSLVKSNSSTTSRPC